MARYARRPIPPRPEGRGLSGFPMNGMTPLLMHRDDVDWSDKMEAWSLNHCPDHEGIKTRRAQCVQML